MPDEVQQAFINLRKGHPDMPVMEIIRNLGEDDLLVPDSVSRSTWYRLSLNNGFRRKKNITEEIQKYEHLSHPSQLWILRVIQGDLSTNELCEQLAPDLDSGVVSHLHKIVLTKPLRKRNKCMTILGRNFRDVHK